MAAAQRQHIRSGQFKPLAVGVPQRLDSLPDVPTWAELGLPDVNLASVFGLMAPAGTPAVVVQRLNQLVNQLLDGPVLKAQLRAADNLPAGGSAARFAALVRQVEVADDEEEGGEAEDDDEEEEDDDDEEDL